MFGPTTSRDTAVSAATNYELNGQSFLTCFKLPT